MDRSNQYTLQNILRCYKKQLLSSALPLKHIKAIEAIAACRTEESGVSAYECQHEDRHLNLVAHSCRHRSCSLCSARSRVEWLEQQKRRLLDCPHFHCVFTLPQEYRVLWQYNTRWFTNALFDDVVRSTLMELIKDESGHGLTPGVLMALHTWGRQLTLHPHIHCVVTGGGVDASGQWKATGEYLLPVKQVKALYRGRMQARIKAAFEAGELKIPPDQSPMSFNWQYKTAYSKNWCVRIEPQYAHGSGVLVYLSRYLRGGPIHPSQIMQCNSEQIAFRYKDHQDGRSKILNLKPMEFIRRLLLHVPESGQHTVRHYGLYAGASRCRRNHCREQLGGLMERMNERDEETVKSLTCKGCGAALRLKWAYYPRHQKGNSYRVESDAGSVQQYDDCVQINLESWEGGVNPEID